MPIRRSPIEEPLPPVPPSGFRGHIAHQLGRLVDRVLGPEETQAFEPVSPAALELGRFAAARTDLERVSRLRIQAKSYAHSLSGRVTLNAVRETLDSDRWDPARTPQPDPTAVVSIFGSNYQKYGNLDPRDIGMCNFYVFPLISGERLIQIVPFTHEEPDASEWPTWLSTLDELFGDRNNVPGILKHKYIRTTIGILNKDDSFISFPRGTNMRPFGCDILPILDRISDERQREDINLQVQAGFITQY